MLFLQPERKESPLSRIYFFTLILPDGTGTSENKWSRSVVCIPKFVEECVHARAFCNSVRVVGCALCAFVRSRVCACMRSRVCACMHIRVSVYLCVYMCVHELMRMCL